MFLARTVAIALLFAGAGAAAAAEGSSCLTQEQRRAAIASRQAVPLGKAMEAARSHLSGEVVWARLCDRGKELVYVLTVLDHNGKVTKVVIDGKSGALIAGH